MPDLRSDAAWCSAENDAPQKSPPQLRDRGAAAVGLAGRRGLVARGRMRAAASSCQHAHARKQKASPKKKAKTVPRLAPDRKIQIVEAALGVIETTPAVAAVLFSGGAQHGASPPRSWR
jgi:hypothetical protein